MTNPSAIIVTAAPIPDRTALEALHHAAHEHCFIANSVRSTIVIEPRCA